MDFERSSGVLLHLTSLPSGRLDRQAYRFVDWLREAGQSWWQLLPLGPPDGLGSPYRAASAFATWGGFLARPKARVTRSELVDFRDRHTYWSDDWRHFAGEEALADQVRIEREWIGLREYAHERGISLLGDLPIYVAAGSADHRLHPELFRGNLVAGAPPDAFNPSGQFWGNPLYDWHANRREGYRWWIERFQRAFELVDVTRIDHFRGFVSYWAVPAGRRTAEAGRWQPGPGAPLFRCVEAAVGSLPLVAEDLGIITQPVIRLRDQLELPGMVLLQFAFGGGPSNPHRLENHRQRSVVYTGTHDHPPIAAWYQRLPGEVRQRIPDLEGPAHWALIRLALSSTAQLAVVQAQDVLGLGEEARMNVPGRKRSNWRWRLRPGQLTRDDARALRALTEECGRLPVRRHGGPTR
ncbi:MAG: 4-alpha-glucanotransferase [Gaiellaceae bacterium]